MSSNTEPAGEAEVFSPQQPKSFLAFLAEQQSGAVVTELSRELRNLVEAIEDHFDHYRGKVSGNLAVTFKLTLEGGVYKVDATYTSSRPKAPPAGTVMWLGHDGNLNTQNPRQLAMPFTSAKG
jgi:hypothetical protein